MLRFRVHALALVLAFALSPGTLKAQAPMQFTVSGFGGALIPAGDLVDELISGGVGLLTIGHKTGFTGGGRIAIWPTGKIGIEIEGMIGLSDVELVGVAPAGGFIEEGTFDANIFLGSLNLVFAAIKPPLDPVSVYISGGIGLVSRSGDAFDGFQDTSDIAGVLGIGLRYGIAPGFRLRIDAKDYISSFQEKALDEALADLGGISSQLQNDVLLTAGVEVFFGAN